MNFLPQDPFEQNVIFFDVSFTCPIAGCHKEFTKGKTYRNHRVKSHGLSRYSCIVCKAPFDAHSELMKHMNQENHLVACTVCNLQFKSPGEATCHFNKKHKQFTCGDCSLIIRGETDLKAHLQFHNQERSPFNAAAFVEVAISSSFSSDLPYEIQVMQDDSRDLRGSVYFPINLDDDSNAPPDSTTQTPSTVSRAPLETVDSSTLTCSDTDTAETVSNSDTETAPSMTPCHEIEDCRSSESPLETARTKTSSFDATDFPGSSVESDPTKTSSFEAGHRRGSSVSTGEAVVFGPGASELLGGNSVDQLTLTSDSPQLLSLTNKEDDTMDWIGHNVDMYQSMSEKHKKTYRYNCSKCSCIFKNKDILRRHLNIHDSICKVCFLRFNSEGEYKKHLHEKHPKLRTFQCSVCGYSLQGLKSLMVHEMVHRLNVAFKREAEDALQLDFHHRILEFYECKFCKERIEGFSKFVRHAVWHNWESMWGTYVAGRIFKGTFTEDEANKFGKEVEDKLGTKWRDCHNRKVVSANTLHGSAAVDQTNTTDKTDSNSVAGVSNISVGASQTTALNNSHPNAANGSEICETSEDHNNEETDAKSETTEETYLSIDGWMNYWNSYLGINESSPSWVKPFIKNLGMQRKSFKADQLGCFYKQMDQISILLHAHKNGTSSLVSPTVSIEKLPTCYINSKIMRNSSVKKLKRAHCGVNNPASNAVRVDTLSTHESLKTTSNPIEESPGPASVKRARSSGPKRSGIVKNDVFQKRDNRVCHRFVKRSVSERAQVWKPPFAREGSKNESIASARSKCPSELDTCEELGDPKKTQSTCGSPSSSKECGSELMRPIVVLSKLDWIKPVIGVQKMAEPDIQVKKIIKPVIQVEKLPEAVVRVEKLREAVIVEKLLEPAVRVEKLPEPVIQVVKMRKPVIRVEQMPEPLIRVEKIVEPVVPVEKITNAALPCNTPKPPSTSDFLQMVAWIQREIGNQKVPKWATTLIYIVCNNSQSKEQKLLKMYQIRNLIKLQFGENGTNVQMPVVKVMRLQ